MKEIQLSYKKQLNQFVAMVDDEDFERVNQFKWCAIRKRKTMSVRCYPKIDGNKKVLYMSRLVLNVDSSNVFVINVDGNALNNQKSNLRLQTSVKPRSLDIDLPASSNEYKVEYHRQYRVKYPERYRAASARNRAKHLEQLREKQKERMRKKRADNPLLWAKMMRENHLKRYFGITIDEYNQLFDTQDGKCAICSNPTEKDKNLSIDHNHITGKTRGLLCSKCNFALGLVNEDISILQNMIKYLLSFVPVVQAAP